MENTDRLRFESDDATWFVAQDERWLGPLRASEVVQRIQQGEFTWAHYGWQQGMKDWTRLCDIEHFAAVVPESPSKIMIADVQRMLHSQVKIPPLPASAAQDSSGPSWFLFYNDSQLGPFSAAEVRRSLKVGKIHGRVHAWREGLKGWERLERLDEFTEAVVHSAPALVKEEATREMRRTERRPVVARILLSNQRTVFVGVCRDISLGGMQVLTDKVPGLVGTHIQLNVSPVEGITKTIAPFTAKGVIVRVLEDGKGFSFRFEELSPKARESIDLFIASS